MSSAAVAPAVPASATGSTSREGSAGLEAMPRAPNEDPKASGSDGSVAPSAKRKRPQSCDTCRSRKIKCVRLQVEGLEQSADQRCVQCRAIDARCTFDYVPKRPGPQSSFSRSAKREQQAHAQVKVQAHARSNTGSTTPQGKLNSADQTPGVGFTPSLSGLDDNWYKAFSASFQNSINQLGMGIGSTRSSSFSSGDNLLTVQSPFSLTPSFGGFDTAGFGLTPPTNQHDNHSTLPGQSAIDALGGQWSQQSIDSMARKFPSTAETGMPAPSDVHRQLQPDQTRFNSVQHQMFNNYQQGSSSNQIRSVPLQVPFPPDSRDQSPFGTTISSILPMASPAAMSDRNRNQQHPHSGSTSQRRPGRSPSLGKVYAGPVLRPRSLDDIAPRQTFLSIMSLYFHYLWPLMPIVDRPSFSYDLIARRDERDESFLAFVLSLTSYTLIQAPRTVIPAPWSLYRKLHRICHLTSRRMQPRRYEPPLLFHVTTLYCDHIYLGTTGQNHAANAVLGEAIRVAYALGLHDERRLDSHHTQKTFGLGSGFNTPSSRPPVNAVERELRKRMFWLLHGSSTTIAVLQDEPAFIKDIDTCVDLPLAVDEDTLVTPNINQRDPSILCGFVTVSRLHQLMSELLEMYRRDRRFPPADLSIAKARLKYISDVLCRIRKALADMPEELRKPTFTHQPPPSTRQPGGHLPHIGNGPPPLQAIGLDPLSQSAFSMQNLPAWPWPADTFTRDGLPNADATSNSSTNHSPKTLAPPSLPDGQVDLEPKSGPGSISDGQSFTTGRGKDSWSPPSAEDRGKIDYTLTTNLTNPFDPRIEPTASPATLNLAMDQVNAFRPSPPPQIDNREPTLSPLCTLHANVIVTEAMARFIMVEYRELISARMTDLRAQGQVDITTDDYGYNDAKDGWEAAARDMLDVLHGMPLEALASNGQSMMSKIIYVVSSLLNRTATNTRGYSYMTSFLHMLTKLSQNRSSADEAISLDSDEE